MTAFDDYLALFAKVWGRFYNRPYTPTASDKSQFGRWFQQAPAWQRDQWPAICDRYLRRRDRWFIDTSHSHCLRYLVTTVLNEFTGPPRKSFDEIAAEEQAAHERRKAKSRRPGVLGETLMEIDKSER